MSGSTLAVVGFAVLATLVATAVALRARRSARRLRERLERSALDLQSLQMAFSQFAPDDVIERIIAGGTGDFAEKKTITVLFADLVGFTELSEHTDPPVLLKILNGYFETMSGVIGENNGYVSTLIGDGMLALFGAIHPNPWQANDAVRAGLAMRSALDDYNASLRAENLPSLSIGIGIHSGSGVTGLVGSRQRREFAFVGRTVNTAARVEDLTRVLGANLIITEAVRERLDPAFELRELPDTAAKGIDEPLKLHAVLSRRERPRPEAPRSEDLS